MKLTAILILSISLQVGAKVGYSQNVSLDFKNAPLKKVFKEIQKQTGYFFLYSNEILEKAEKVNIIVQNIPLQTAIYKCLQNSSLTYSIVEKTIIIKSKGLHPLGEIQFATLPPPLEIKGIVTDSMGQPLKGASVKLMGTKTGTITDENGNYLLKVPGAGGILEISFIGYENQELRVSKSGSVNFSLKVKKTQLEDVIVIGYGTVKKSDLTGSVSSVKGETITRAGSASFDQALQGRVAGVNVSSNSGLPGGGTTIRIRGIGSINSGNDPLFVVDGMPIGGGPNSANLLNSDDIEQIEILKDASAAAIYGSQGANGVILVTTKRGKSGIPQLIFDTYYGTKSIHNKWQPGDAAQFGEVYLLGKKASGTAITDIYNYYKPYYSLMDNIDFTKDYSAVQQNIYNTLKKDHPGSTDWMPALFRTGMVNNYNLALSGGTEAMRYSTSVGYYKEDGIIKTTGYDRLTLRFNGDYKISSKLKAGTYLTVVNSNRIGINPLLPNNQTGGLNFHSDNSILSQAYEIDPVTQIRRTPAEALAAGGNPANPFDLYSAALYSGTSNPVAGLERSNIKYNQFQLLGNAFAEYTIVKYLALKSSIGINFSSGQESSSIPNYYISGSDRNLLNSVKRVNDRGSNWDWINQLTFSRSFNKHNITLMAAMDASHSSYQSVTASRSSTPSNSPNLQYLNNATGNASADENIMEGALLSYIGRLSYVYNNKYLLTGTFRRDGSSSFSPGYRWGNFSSVGVGYKLSEESFFKKLNFKQINLLKLRGSFGQLGNSAVPAYSNVSLYNGTSHVTYPFGPVTAFQGGGVANYPYQALTQGVIPYKIGNEALKWETSEQSNFGIDLNMYNKISFTADYFIKTSKDNILQVPVPPNVGYAYSLPFSNNGKLQNKGFEFTGEYKDKIGALEFSLGGNISFVKNKVISLGYKDASYQHYGRGFSGIPYRTIEGHPLADFYGFKTNGIFQTQDEINSYKTKNGDLIQPNARPGDFRFVSMNQNKVLNDSDKVVLGSPLPKYTFGFNVSLTFKDVDLDLFFQGQQGNKILMYEKYFIYRGQGNSNSIKDLPSIAWHGPQTSNSQPRISADDPNDNFRMSNYYLEDGSYIRLKMLQIGYHIPKSICSKLKVASIKVYGSAENLLTFTKFPGSDPEIASTDIQNMGFSSFEYSQPRTLRCGIKVGF